MKHRLFTSAADLRIAERLRDLTAVAAARFTREGILLDQNAGFARLLPGVEPGEPRDLRDLFINPRFDTFAARRGEFLSGSVYTGILTLGDADGVTRALRGTISQVGDHLELIAEYDVAQMEISIRVLHALTAELSQMQQTATHDAEAARHHAETHHQLLVGELHHRMRNLLHVVKIMAGKSIPCGPQEMETFFGRLDALARAQSLKPVATGADARLLETVNAALTPHLQYPARIRIRGPNMPLPGQAAEALLLALHELATNALKYGALSTDGDVSVTWRRKIGNDGDPWVVLVWKETGGPAIRQPPSQTGFGTRLIERAVRNAGGSVRRDWRRTGLLLTMVIPLGAWAAC